MKSLHGHVCRTLVQWWRCSFLITIILSFSFLPICLSAQSEGERVELRIVDDEDGSPLPSALVSLCDQRTLSDANGRVILSLKSSSPCQEVTITLTGYQTHRISVTELRAKRGNPKVIRLRFRSKTLEELSIEAKRPLPALSAVGERIDLSHLHGEVAPGLAEVLSDVKGMSMISSGTTSSIPVIQGMSGKRILIISDGVKQEGQQWNNEFGTEPLLGFRATVTVLKGAESVRYGADALGGVILVEEEPLPYGSKPIGGEVKGHYGTNGQSYGIGTLLEGALGKGETLAYRVQSDYSSGGDRSTADYILNNTGTRAFSLKASLGIRGDHYTTDVVYAHTSHTEGIMYEAKMGNSERLRERIRAGRPLVERPFSREIDYPKHSDLHRYIKWDATYHTPNLGTLSGKLAYQQDKRNEYHYRRMKRSSIPSVSLTLHNLQGATKWMSPLYGALSSEIGADGQYLNNINRPGTGVVPLIPNYIEETIGLYFVEKYTREKWGLEAGLRGDLSHLSALGIDAYSQTYGGERRFRSFTYTVGAQYRPTSQISLITNYGTAWRAPHVGELWSNGIDASGSLYLRGDSTMTTEKSHKWVASLSYESRKFAVSMEGFVNHVDGYIYKEPTGEEYTVISGVYPLFRYRQTSATLSGADFEARAEIFPCLSYRAMAGIIFASERKTGRYLPYIPPFRLRESVTLNLPLGKETTLEVGHRYVAQQKRFDPETDLIPYAPPAYHLFDLTGSSSWSVAKGSSLTVTVSVDNLFNRLYKEYTNLARYYSHEAGRDIRFSLRYTF